jgi:hypothetical protein
MENKFVDVHDAIIARQDEQICAFVQNKIVLCVFKGRCLGICDIFVDGLGSG